MLKANNTLSTSKQANNGESRMLLSQTLSDHAKNHLKNAFQDGYSNKRNLNIKEMLSLIQNYFCQVNQISFSSKLNSNHDYVKRFSSQRVIQYLVDQFQYCLLIKYIKVPTILKHEQFEDSKGIKTELGISKFQRQMNMHDNDKR